MYESIHFVFKFAGLNWSIPIRSMEINGYDYFTDNLNNEEKFTKLKNNINFANEKFNNNKLDVQNESNTDNNINNINKTDVFNDNNERYLKYIKKYINGGIKFSNVPIKSSLEYLSDRGIIERKNSNLELIKNVYFIKNLNVDEEGIYLQSDIEKNNLNKIENIENYENNNFNDLIPSFDKENIKILTSDIKNNYLLNKNISKLNDYKFNNISNNENNISNTINNENNVSNTINNENNISNNEIKDEIVPENTQIYTISTFHFILLKFLNIFGDRRGRILYNYTEFEYIPLLLQIFFHIPLIITAIIIFIVILTFDPEMNQDLIKNEINKLPETEYKTEMNCPECTVCLENFIEGENVRILKCSHCFHKTCIDSWLINSLHCPICRASVSKITETIGYEMYRNMNYI